MVTALVVGAWGLLVVCIWAFMLAIGKTDHDTDNDDYNEGE